jgi:hypothetical protein
MVPSLDIFRIESGGVLWCGAAETIESAKDRIEELAHSSPGSYIIFNQTTGRRIPVTPGFAAQTEAPKCRTRPSWTASWCGLKRSDFRAGCALPAAGSLKLQDHLSATRSRK